MIQWYPGHMAKAKKILTRDLKLVDLVIEVLDARIPASSRNPDLDQLLDNKKRIVALNKEDLADRKITGEWLLFFKKKHPAVRVNSLGGQGMKELMSLLKRVSGELKKHVREKERTARDLRIMVIGIPNVGKSALINRLAGTAVTRTANRPGVTRGRQWIKIADEIRLLDTPGILWPKFDDEDVGYKLAVTGAIKDNLFDEELAAYKLLKYLLEINEEIVSNNYQLGSETVEPYDILELIGRKKGCLMSGGKVDRLRASRLLINDFRSGKLGLVSLERPDEGGEG